MEEKEKEIEKEKEEEDQHRPREAETTQGRPATTSQEATPAKAVKRVSICECAYYRECVCGCVSPDNTRQAGRKTHEGPERVGRR